jgi:alkylhydroperoxidase/carboxymuconolactone decarboxylase family protein YurZ
MTEPVYPARTSDLARKRQDLAPDTQAAFNAFSQRAFADGALSAKMKQLIAVAVAHVTQCRTASRGIPKRRDVPARVLRN